MSLILQSLIVKAATQKPLLNTFTASDSLLHIEYEILKDIHAQKSFDLISRLGDTAYYSIPDLEKICVPGKIYWLKFKIDNQSDANLILETNQYYKINEFYFPDKGNYSVKATGINSWPFTKELISTTTLTELKNQKGIKTYYLKISCDVAIGLGCIVFNMDHVYKNAVTTFTYYGLFFGIIMVILIYNIIFYFKIKERSYLYYFGYLACLLSYKMFTWGFGMPVFDFLFFNYIYLTIPFMGSTIFFLLYTREVLQTKLLFPDIDKYLLIAICLRIISFSIGIITKSIYFNDQLVDTLLLFPALLAGIQSFRGGYAPSRYFLPSIAILYAGFMFKSIESIVNTFNSHFPDSHEYDFLYSNIWIIQVLLLSFTLAERFNELRENLEIKLQKLVDDRTIELKDANQKLNTQAEEIRRINILLEKDNQKLIHDVEVIQKARVLNSNMNFDEFQTTFPTEEAGGAFIAELKWKNGFVCRKCGYKKYHQGNVSFSRRCRSCGHQESPTADTLLDNVKFSILKALYLVYSSYHNKNINVKQVSEQIKLREGTALHFVKKVMEVIAKRKIKKGAHNDWTDLLLPASNEH